MMEIPHFLAVKNNMMISQMLDYAGADKSIKNNNGEFIIDESKQELSDSEPEIILENSEIVDLNSR